MFKSFSLHLDRGICVAAKLLQSCLTLCDPINGSQPGSPVPGILQARTLEWVAISFSNAGKWKWKWSRSVTSDSSWSHGLQPSRLLRPWDFLGKSTGVGCHCLLLFCCYTPLKQKYSHTNLLYTYRQRIFHMYAYRPPRVNRTIFCPWVRILEFFPNRFNTNAQPNQKTNHVKQPLMLI